VNHQTKGVHRRGWNSLLWSSSHSFLVFNVTSPPKSCSYKNCLRFCWR
jgi:hypothetical protein